MPQIHFYLTPGDIVNVLRDVEARISVSYASSGMFPSGTPIDHYTSATEIPSLGETSASSGIASRSFLVLPRGIAAVARNAGAYIVVDQAGNPSGIDVRPGGRHPSGALLDGAVSSLSEEPTAKKLMSTFRSVLRRRCVKIGYCLVGAEAEQLLRSGGRLTIGIDSPPGYDVPIPDPAAARAQNPERRSKRMTYPDSIRVLEQLGLVDPTAGPELFRTRLEDADLSYLTLTGMFIGRSEIASTSFRNSDLRHSVLCWNDFTGVDFTNACLADCDLRASTFTDCVFTKADLEGALLSRKQDLSLSATQRKTIHWSDEEPPGG